MKQLKESLLDKDFDIKFDYDINKMPWAHCCRIGEIIIDYVQQVAAQTLWKNVEALGQTIADTEKKYGIRFRGDDDSAAGVLQTIKWYANNRSSKFNQPNIKPPHPMITVIADIMDSLCKDRKIYNMFDAYVGENEWHNPIYIKIDNDQKSFFIGLFTSKSSNPNMPQKEADYFFEKAPEILKRHRKVDHTEITKIYNDGDDKKLTIYFK